jgi:hypothetical protein
VQQATYFEHQDVLKGSKPYPGHNVNVIYQITKGPSLLAPEKAITR